MIFLTAKFTKPIIVFSLPFSRADPLAKFDFGLQRDYAGRAYGLGMMAKNIMDSPYGPGK